MNIISGNHLIIFLCAQSAWHGIEIELKRNGDGKETKKSERARGRRRKRNEFKNFSHLQ